MKKIVIFIICSLLLVGCANTYCPKKESGAEFELLKAKFATFIDQETLAQSTSRIALAPVIGAMQATKREYDAITVHECLKTVQSSYSHGMDYTIQGFLSFMSQDPETIQQMYFEEAGNFIGVGNQKLDEFNACFPNCKP